MKKKLNCILLIDDDKITNILNKLVINRIDCANEVISVKNGVKALEFLTSGETDKHPKPDLILLDINMPGMNGWEFLEKYNKLDKKYRGNVVVVMLSTSLNPDDQEKSQKQEDISSFINKPLTTKQFHKIMEDHFPNMEL